MGNKIYVILSALLTATSFAEFLGYVLDLYNPTTISIGGNMLLLALIFFGMTIESLKEWRK